MKSVLSIILWVFAPMLTPYGLQIGEVKTNNQTIKIMKNFILSPEWLQSAGNVGVPKTRFVLTEDSGSKVQLSANGSVIVEYVQDGEIVRNTYIALSDTYVPIPAGVEATVYGDVTVINYDENNNIFSLLDVSKNTALTELNCSNCTGLTLLDIQNTDQLNNGNLFFGISTNLMTLQVAGTSAWAYEQVESWLSGDAPSGGTILVDENTPEGVITAATGKSWAVEYVDAA